MSARRLCGLFSGITACAVLLLVLAMGGESGAQSTADYAAILAAPDRSDADRQADTRRDPKPFLAFAGLRPGMKVLDMGAGGGYSTELMARAVAPNGMVWGQYPPDGPARAIDALQARMKTPAMKDAAADLRPFDDPNLLLNMSVWEDIESLEKFVFQTAHTAIYRKKANWFEPMQAPHFVMWWIDAGHIPTPAEAKERLDHLAANGASEFAFDWEAAPQAKLWREKRCA